MRVPCRVEPGGGERRPHGKSCGTRDPTQYGADDPQSGTAAASGTTTANTSARAARLADCRVAAGTGPSGPGSARVAVAPAATVGAKPRLNALWAGEFTHVCVM